MNVPPFQCFILRGLFKGVEILNLVFSNISLTVEAEHRLEEESDPLFIPQSLNSAFPFYHTQETCTL